MSQSQNAKKESGMSRVTGLIAHSAAQQLQHAFPQVGVQALPAGAPGRVTGEGVGITEGGPLVFYVIGDHGGVKAPGPQESVAHALRESRQKDGASFIYSVGDIVYFNGDASQYGPQFYEPYSDIPVPFVGIPGNHDGDTTDDPSRLPLDTFMANFCAGSPGMPVADPQMEYGRHTQTQPYCDWTLALSAVSIIGLYSNVPSGGHLEPSQTDWLVQELKSAPATVPVIVALHHPPYSVDAHHGGSAHMGQALDSAFQASGRWADLVLSGHVHDYQRFTRCWTPTENAADAKKTVYVVSGNGGYHNLHRLASDATPDSQPAPGVVFDYGDDSHYGFLKLSVASGRISGEYVGVRPGTMPDGSDASITAGLDTFVV